jgi:hypothetical protein
MHRTGTLRGWMALLGCALAVCARLSADDQLETLFRAAEAQPGSRAVSSVILFASARIRELDAVQGCALAQRLAPWCSRMFLSAQRLPGMERCGLTLHQVRSKETITSIARHFHMQVGLLRRLNDGLGKHRCTVGRMLKVLDGRRVPVHAVVERSGFCLEIWHGSILVAAFPAGLGGDAHPTPLGRTTIACCVRNPQWRDPESGRTYGPHDAGNVLGGYWIGFTPGAHARFHGIGMHGYTAQDPQEWLGKAESHGCVRLRQHDVSAAFDLMRPGVRVEVRP